MSEAIRIQPAANRTSRRDRRAGQRDRRLLNGTMKYRGEFVHVEVMNLSQAGAYVVATQTPALSDSVTLSILLPCCGSTLTVTGRVRRVGLGSRALSQPGGFGVQFTRFFSQVGREDLHHHLAA